MTTNYVIGIDFGSFCSTVAVKRPEGIDIIPIDGKDRFPNIVTFTENECHVGVSTDDLKCECGTTISNVRQLLGRTFCHPDVQEFKELGLCSVVKGMNDRVLLKVPGHGTYLPEEIVAIILRKLRSAASDFLHHDVVEAVICLPDYFDADQRYALEAAGHIAGLTICKIIDDRDAAAMFFQDNFFAPAPRGALLVYDIGRSLKMSLYTFAQDDSLEIVCVARANDPNLGEAEFRKKLVDYCLEEVRKLHGDLVASQPETLTQLRRACAAAESALRTKEQCLIEVKLGDIDFVTSVTRFLLNKVWADELERCRKLLNDMLATTNEAVGGMLLLGGMRSIPAVEAIFADVFGDEIWSITNEVFSVVKGAALAAERFHLRNLETVDKIDWHTTDQPLYTSRVVKAPAHPNPDLSREDRSVRSYSSDSLEKASLRQPRGSLRRVSARTSHKAARRPIPQPVATVARPVAQPVATGARPVAEEQSQIPVTRLSLAEMHQLKVRCDLLTKAHGPIHPPHSTHERDCVSAYTSCIRDLLRKSGTGRQVNPLDMQSALEAVQRSIHHLRALGETGDDSRDLDVLDLELHRLISELDNGGSAPTYNTVQESLMTAEQPKMSTRDVLQEETSLGDESCIESSANTLQCE